MNVILLHSGHRHVSANHVAIFRVMGTRIQVQLCFEITPQFKKSYDFWLKFAI